MWHEADSQSERTADIGGASPYELPEEQHEREQAQQPAPDFTVQHTPVERTLRWAMTGSAMVAHEDVDHELMFEMLQHGSFQRPHAFGTLSLTDNWDATFDIDGGNMAMHLVERRLKKYAKEHGWEYGGIVDDDGIPFEVPKTSRVGMAIDPANLPPILYHWTDASRVPSIMRQGLTPRSESGFADAAMGEGKQFGRSDVVYLCSEDFADGGYGDTADAIFDHPVLLMVSTRDLDPQSFVLDLDVANELRHEESEVQEQYADLNAISPRPLDMPEDDWVQQHSGILDRPDNVNYGLHYWGTVGYRGTISPSAIKVIDQHVATALGEDSNGDKGFMNKEWGGTGTHDQMPPPGFHTLTDETEEAPEQGAYYCRDCAVDLPDMRSYQKHIRSEHMRDPRLPSARPEPVVDYDDVLIPRWQDNMPLQERAASAKVAAETSSQILRRMQEMEERGEVRPDRSEVVHQFPDGWTINKMRYVGDVVYEGCSAGHCWSEGWESHSPDNALDPAQGYRDDYYSLRDPQGIPRVSFYYSDRGNYIEQPFGRHNTKPKPEYIERILQWQPDAQIEHDEWDDIVNPRLVQSSALMRYYARDTALPSLPAPLPFTFDIEADRLSLGLPGQKVTDISDGSPDIEGVYDPKGNMQIRADTTLPWTVQHLVRMWYRMMPEFEVKGVVRLMGEDSVKIAALDVTDEMVEGFRLAMGLHGDLPEGLRFEIHGGGAEQSVWAFVDGVEEGGLPYSLAGSLDLKWDETDEHWVIDGIRVKPNWRRRGIAEAMLEHARDEIGWVEHDWHNLSDDARGWIEGLGEGIDPWDERARFSSILDDVRDTLSPVFDDPAADAPDLRPEVVEWVWNFVRDAMIEGGWPDPDGYLSLVLTGSLTTYQWDEHSDFDCSLFIDTERLPDWVRSDLIAIMVAAVQDVTVPGTSHPLELYVVPDGITREELYQPGLRAGYELPSFDQVQRGIRKGDWIVPPDRTLSDDVKLSQPTLIAYCRMVEDKARTLLKYNPEMARIYLKHIKDERRRSMQAGEGNFSTENIRYKWLEYTGLMDEASAVLSSRLRDPDASATVEDDDSPHAQAPARLSLRESSPSRHEHEAVPLGRGGSGVGQVLPALHEGAAPQGWRERSVSGVQHPAGRAALSALPEASPESRDRGGHPAVGRGAWLEREPHQGGAHAGDHPPLRPPVHGGLGSRRAVLDADLRVRPSEWVDVSLRHRVGADGGRPADEAQPSDLDAAQAAAYELEKIDWRSIPTGWGGPKIVKHLIDSYDLPTLKLGERSKGMGHFPVEWTDPMGNAHSFTVGSGTHGKEKDGERTLKTLKQCLRPDGACRHGHRWGEQLQEAVDASMEEFADDSWPPVPGQTVMVDGVQYQVGNNADGEHVGVYGPEGDRMLNLRTRQIDASWREASQPYWADDTEPEHMLKMEEVEMVPIDDLLPAAEWDRRPSAPKVEISGEQASQGADPDYWDTLVEHIRQNGILSPLILQYNPDTGEAYIGEGNHRLRAAQDAGLTEVPVVVYRSRRGVGHGGVHLKLKPLGGQTNEHGYEKHVPQYIAPSEVGLRTSSWQKAAGAKTVYRGLPLGDYDTREEARAAAKDAPNVILSDVKDLYGNRLGVHWTTDYSVAEAFAAGMGGPVLDSSMLEGWVVGVVLEASVDAEHIIEPGSEEWEEFAGDEIFDTSHPEQEVTLRPGSPLTLTNIDALILGDGEYDVISHRIDRRFEAKWRES